MGTSPTTKSALLSGAAKDDTLGQDGVFTFTISDLLGNDPGGAAKVDVTKQFFFGDTAADQKNQVQYLIDHGIKDNGDGSYTVEAGHDFNYFVQMGNKGTWSTAHVDVADAPEPEPVVPSNHDPVAVNDTDTVAEDAILKGNVSSNDSDPDGNALTFSLNAPVAGLDFKADGSYEFNAGGAEFQSLGVGESKVVTANYTVNDGHGGTSTATLSITVTGTNDAPVAQPIEAHIIENSDTDQVKMSAAFKDVDFNNTHTFSVDVTGTVGEVTNNLDGTFNYDANGKFEYLAADESATDTFTYTVTDKNGAKSTQTATITVQGENDGPVANADDNAVTEDAALPVTGNVLANDTDVDTHDTHVVKSVGGAAVDADGIDVQGTYGTLHINADGEYSYSLDNTKAEVQALAKGEVVTESFNYTNADNHGGVSNADLVIKITGTNDAPVATDDTKAGLEDTIISGNVGANDTDVDHGAVLKYALTGDIPAGLTMDVQGNYSLDANNAAYRDIHNGEMKDFVANYTVTDEHGVSDTATLTITITGNADIYHDGFVQSATQTKTATASSGNHNETSETFHFNLTPDDGFNASNANVTITVKGDIDGANEHATVIEVAGLDFVDGAGEGVFRFGGTVGNGNGNGGGDNGENDGFSKDDFTLTGSPVELATALADGHVDFDVTLSNEVGNGSTITASMTYDYWM